MDRAAREFLRALRGARSQRALAKRLGYRGNPITDWENGRRFPTAEETLRAAIRVGIDVPSAFRSFHQAAPPEQEGDAIRIAAWLERIRGTARINDLAQRIGISRYALYRYLRGDATPRLPNFFRIVDGITDRLPQLVAALVPIEAVPSLHPRFLAAEAARLSAYEAPWTEAILRVLELEQYRTSSAHSDEYIADCLGIGVEEVQMSIDLLERSGVVRLVCRHYQEDRPLTVDTRGSVEVIDRLLTHWLGVAGQKVMTRSAQQLFAYNVVAVSEVDYRRIRALLASTFREVGAIVAASQPAQRVAMVSLQWLALDDANAPAEGPAPGPD